MIWSPPAFGARNLCGKRSVKAMDLITSHVNTDMDALGAMVGASLLYPGARMVFPGKLAPDVEEFMALYRDVFPIRQAREVNLRDVDRLILVDTRNPARLNTLAGLLSREGLRIHVFDHHPAADGDIIGNPAVVEPVGATTTLIVEAIKARGIAISALEATVMALGIYGDTGSLLFSSTTPRDAQAVAYLLAHDANLAVVSEFMERPFTPEQNELFKKLLLDAVVTISNGVRIMIARGTAGDYVSGLALLTHRLAEVEHLDVIFTVTAMDDRVYVVGRSRTPLVDVGEIAAVFGGGGHPMAASATIKKAVLTEISEKLLAVTLEKIRAPLTVQTIMSTPVKTVTLRTTIDDAARVMVRYGHTGLPVIDNDRLVGVISRRDVEKAVVHGMGHAPVLGYMTGRVLAVAPADPVVRAQELMIEHNIGRLPVLEDGRLVGIVSRTDLLRSLHGGEVKLRHTDLFRPAAGPANLRDLLARLDPHVAQVLEAAGRLGRDTGCQVFAAGGMVRDILLQARSFDIDLVVEGDGINFALALALALGGRARIHKKFNTAKVFFPSGLRVDVATARVEYYQFPAALPQVESSSLKHDLYRRDFTINAMAIALNPERLGELVDFYGSRSDLRHGVLRVLHNLSFIEDPTRMLRAVRFEQRYHLTMEDNTRRFLDLAVAGNMPARLQPVRIWTELRLILEEDNPAPMLKRLFDLKMWPMILPEVTLWEVHPVLSRLPRAIRLLAFWGQTPYAEPWLPYWLALLHWTDLLSAVAVNDRFQLSHRVRQVMEKTLEKWRPALDGLYDPNLKMSGLCALLQGLPREAYPLLAAISEEDAGRDRLRQAVRIMREAGLSINGRDIIQMGYSPGPSVGRALAKLRAARWDGLIEGRPEELALAQKLMRGEEPFAF